MKLAVLDFGSQSFHVAVYQATHDRGIVRLDRFKEMVRLGAGTLKRGLIDDVTWDRGLSAAERLIVRAHAQGAQLLVAVATSAVREAANGAAFCRDIQRHHGLPVEILSGAEEAELVYRGARSGLPVPSGSVAVLDLGGGSLEIGIGDGPTCSLTCSLPVGALRLRDALVPSDGYVSERTAEDIARVVRATLAVSAEALRAASPAVIALNSGTSRAVAALANDLGSGAGNAPEITVHALRRLIAILAKLRPTELPSLGVEEGRTDTIATAAVVLHTVFEELGWTSARLVDRGLREGVALRELARLAAARQPRPAATP